MEVPRGFTRCDEPEDPIDCRECGDDAHLTFPSALLGAPDFHEYECSSCGLAQYCPSCSGSGLVPTEKLREEATQAMRSMWEHKPHSFADQADAVLRKVAEHIGEGR